jgi:ABC-2 type transport system ATP-binding protein
MADSLGSYAPSPALTPEPAGLLAVEACALEKQYRGVQALAGLSLSIQPGEIFAVLGPNGAGKTTWISIVCGLVRPSAGVARVFGHDVVTDAVAARKLVGLVPQEMNFDPFFTPREALTFQMGYYGQRPDGARVDEVLAAMDLTAKADTNTRALSGGMKRRLLIGKALVHRPRVVFLDEPTAGVDVGLRRDLWLYVRRLRSEGTTIVLTTHYLEEAEALADRVAVIDKGSLICLDAPRRLMARFGQKQIRVTLASPLGTGDADAIPGPLREFSATLDATRRVLTCPVEGAVLPQLLGRLAALAPRVIDVDVVSPSLEQVFLKLTRTDIGDAP